MASADYKGIVDFAQAIDDTYVRKDAPSVPVGGAKGEVLRKKSNADGDAEWANPRAHFSTLAEMQAALALGQIPDGANVSVEEEQPGGNTGDTSLDTTSKNWVQNKVVAAAAEQLRSELTSKGSWTSGTHNANDLPLNSVYRCLGSVTSNLPASADEWTVFTDGYNSNLICQTAWRMSNNTIFSRVYYNSAWSNWKSQTP